MRFTAGIPRPLKVTVEGKDWSTHMVTVEDCLKDRQVALDRGYDPDACLILDGRGKDITKKCLSGEIT